ncbi:MAG: copper resistance protein CopC [Actinomycetota bacterium]
MTLRRLLPLVTALLALVILPTTAASAHTDLLRGSPGPAQRAGGTVDFIDLVFLEVVTEFDVIVEDPNGEPLSGTLSGTEGQLFRYQLDEPLTETGRYIVRYTMISADGDDTATGYFFTFEESAPQPLPLGEIDIPDNGTPWLAIVAAVVFCLCLIGLAMIFLTRLEQKRAATGAESTPEETPVGDQAE